MWRPRATLALEALVRGERSARGWQWVERALLIIGMVCVGYYAGHSLGAWSYQRQQTEAFETMLQSTPLPPIPALSRVTLPSDANTRVRVGDAQARHGSDGRTPNAMARASAARHDPKGVVALLEIPRLKISSPVMSGDDESTLDVAVGHLPDTPKPWEPGNSALAAHRDGLFRPLRNVRVGDEVRVRTEHGQFLYQVRETRVVRPDDLSVLAPTDDHTLTLITCYPFNFIGHAPKRFIVHATRVDSPLSTQ